MIGLQLYVTVKTLADTAKADCFSAGGCDTGLPKVNANQQTLTNILDYAFGVIGAIAVLMFVIGGLRFVTSEGNPEDAAKARSTMIYAAVGLVISLAAYSMVQFAIGKF